MKDIKLCCDCLRDLTGFYEFDIIRVSELPVEEQEFNKERFDRDDLIGVYLCRTCYQTRFIKYFNRKKSMVP